MCTAVGLLLSDKGRQEEAHHSTWPGVWKARTRRSSRTLPSPYSATLVSPCTQTGLSRWQSCREARKAGPQAGAAHMDETAGPALSCWHQNDASAAASCVDCPCLVLLGHPAATAAAGRQHLAQENGGQLDLAHAVSLEGLQCRSW